MNIKKHPTFLYTDDILTICQPLLKLNINYFAHVHIDSSGCFSAIGNNPAFGEHYLTNQYYNADIHMAENNYFGRYIIWDAIERGGQSLKMHTEAAEFSVRHTFTIVEKDNSGSHFYHFANKDLSPAINQIYLTNLELLKLFINHFNYNVGQSKLLKSAYNFKFALDNDGPGFITTNKDNIIIPEFEFRRELQLDSQLQKLSKRQLDCLFFLSRGMTVKEIASNLHLAPKTVEHYLENIKLKLNCYSRSELISKFIKNEDLYR